MKSNKIKIKTLNFDVVLNPCGASLQSLKFNNTQVLLSINDTKSFNNADLFFGKTLAPVAGRIPNIIKINNKNYNLCEDEKNVSLHSGKKQSLSFKYFDYEIKENDKFTSVIFKISNTKKDLFPFDVNLYITYQFSKDSGECIIFYDADIKEDLLISMSNHCYFNFSTSDINSYLLQINSSNIGFFYPNSKLIEGIKKVNDDFDFSIPSLLKDKLDIIDKKYSGLDHFFLFNKVDENIPQIILSNDKIKLEIFTSMQGSNIYVDSTKTKYPFSNKKLSPTRRGIALECQNQNFPYTNIIYKKGEKYHQFIKYKFYNV